MSAFHGVVPTGVPERGFSADEAEALRQNRLTTGVRERDPAVFEGMVEATLKQRVAQAEYEAARLKLAGAVSPGQLGDVLAEVGREADRRTLAAAAQAHAAKGKKPQ